MIRAGKILFCLVSGLASVDANDSVKQAVEKALPYLEAEGTWWIEDKKCVSCHHSTFFIWAKDLASEAGFDVDISALDEQRRWVWESLLQERKEDPDNPKSKVEPGEKIGDKNVEALAQFLLSTSEKSLPEDARIAFGEIIARRQNEAGNWPAGGQLPLQQRPKQETQWVSNLWIQTAATVSGVEIQRDAIVPTGKIKQAKSTEWFAMNAVFTQSKEAIEALLERQNSDGGWSWIDGESSSPTGTGQALLALARTGESKRQIEAIERARRYLLQTQSEDGHWETKSTKKRGKSGRISDFWGSAWAVIGLLEVEKN